MSLSAEKSAEFSEKGITMPGLHPMIIGEMAFEPPVTLNGCVIVGPVTIGIFSYVGDFTRIDNFTTIGRYCSIASSCTIGAASHPLDWLSSHPFQYHAGTEPGVSKRQRDNPPTNIGHDVWIGANTVVLAGVTVGTGAVIGAGSFVTRNVPPYAVVVGTPAKGLRFRFPPQIAAELLGLAWWDLPIQDIAELPFDDIAACLAVLREKRAATR